MQSAAEAWAHVVHAPAGGNRGDQLVVGAQVGTSKNENPGRCGLPGFLAGRRIAFQSDRSRCQVAKVALITWVVLHMMSEIVVARDRGSKIGIAALWAGR